MRFGTYTLKVTFFLCLVLFYAVGCGSDEPPVRGNQIINTPDVEEDELDTEEDAENENGNKEDLCTEVDCDPGFVCVEGTCEAEAAEGFACAVPRELGPLSEGGHQIKVDAVEGQPNQQQTSCASEDFSPEAVFSFSVAETSRITPRIIESEQNLVIEVREGACSNPEAGQFCDGGSGLQNFYASPGTTYYLIVEARAAFDIGAFTLELEVERLACAPADSWTCEGNQRTLCLRGEEERTYDCAVGCDGSVCLGDSCQNPIEVTASTTLTGNLVPFSNHIDLAESPSCSTEGTTGPDTPGKEVIIMLRNLQPAQTVIVDASGNPFATAIGITKGCSSGTISCIAADSTSNVLEWSVVDGGDYFLIIDARRPQDADFIYSIEILE